MYSENKYNLIFIEAKQNVIYLILCPFFAADEITAETDKS